MTTGVNVLNCLRLKGLTEFSRKVLLVLLCLGAVAQSAPRYPAASLDLPPIIRGRNLRSQSHSRGSRNSAPLPSGLRLRSLEEEQEEGSKEVDGGGGLAKEDEGDYNSYERFNPDQFERNSPEWHLAMIRFLLDMKKNGHKISEFVANKPLPALQEHLAQNDISVESGPIICKMEPFNICYKVDDDGNMHPVGDRRPVRLLRVY